MKGIPVFPTEVETHQDIFGSPEANHGISGLRDIGNRNDKVQELESFFGVIFANMWQVVKIEDI
jgi:hypothetical protein